MKLNALDWVVIAAVTVVLISSAWRVFGERSDPPVQEE